MLDDSSGPTREACRMGVEIERKFLVIGDGWQEAADAGTAIHQGYLATTPERTVRVRVTDEGAWLTIKGAARGAVRAEFEYPIPGDEAAHLLNLSETGIVEKIRYRVQHAKRTWEVDVFGGENAGLVLAEIELESEDADVELPRWVGEEVTGRTEFTNSQLAQHPFTRW
jgi:adenylate cyclase